MATKASEVSTQVESMFQGDVTSGAISLAIDDAKVFLKKYGIDDSDDNYSIGLRYYACHILYMWGLNQRATSISVDDVSVTNKDLELGDKEGSSPYLVEFRKLFSFNDFLTSP